MTQEQRCSAEAQSLIDLIPSDEMDRFCCELPTGIHFLDLSQLKTAEDDAVSQ